MLFAFNIDKGELLHHENYTGLSQITSSGLINDNNCIPFKRGSLMNCRRILI